MVGPRRSHHCDASVAVIFLVVLGRCGNAVFYFSKLYHIKA